MKKLEVEGYIARYDNDILFSNQPMWKDGFWGEGVWYETLESDERYPLDLRVDMHKYLDIPELTFGNSPRRCKLTIEIGEQLPGSEPKDRERLEKALRIRRHVADLASITRMTADEVSSALRRHLPAIGEYMTED